MRIAEQYLAQLNIEKRRWRRAAAILTVLSLIVATGVAWNLRMTGITIANGAACGLEEHRHTAECPVEKVLICGYDEEIPTEDPAELPTEAPLEEELPAEELPEEEPFEEEIPAEEPMEEEVFFEEEAPIEEEPLEEEPPEETGEEENLPASMMQRAAKLLSGFGLTAHAAELPAEDVHIHTEDCYEIVYLCGLEEHIHDLSCYSDTTADLESAMDWEADLPELTEDWMKDWAEDLVAVAESQLGNTESERNYIVEDDGETQKGITRYGQWYGNPYGDWSSMFVMFCMNYADIPEDAIPQSPGVYNMMRLAEREGIFLLPEEDLMCSGSLLFLDTDENGKADHMAIVTDYDMEEGILTAIVGDWENEVAEIELEMDDPMILGGIDIRQAQEAWEAEEEEEAPVEEIEEEELLEPTEEELPGETGEMIDLSNLDEETLAELQDISNGPAIYVLTAAPSQTEEMQTLQQAPFMLRTPRTVTDLSGYSHFFALQDTNGHDLPKDENNNYIVEPNQAYKLVVGFDSADGFPPGTYRYQVPNGLLIEGGSGELRLKIRTPEGLVDGPIVGDWEVTDTGLVTIVLNNEMNDKTNANIGVALGIKFSEQQVPYDFDGQITVTVQKPPEVEDPTKIVKWGKPGNAEDAKEGWDPEKIYWSIEVTGGKDSQIPGNILSDRIVSSDGSKEHRYTPSDMAGGLTIGVSEPDPITGDQKSWHAWTVYPDDPRLVWTETEWSYKMPETAICQWCGEVELGNDNWIYNIQFTSTPDKESIAGTYGYENNAYIDGQHSYAWINMTHGDAHGDIEKSGIFASDGEDGRFTWEVRATLPGVPAGQRADYHWYMMDSMYLLDQHGNRIGHIENNAHLSAVTAEIGGATVSVPRLEEATANDNFAWYLSWSAEANGIPYGREIQFFSRCSCSADNCMYWDSDANNCGTRQQWVNSDFCQCWTTEEEVTFVFEYTTDALPLIEKYSSLGYQVQNYAELFYMPDGYSSTGGTSVDNDKDTVVIPSLFEKTLTKEYDGYNAHYRITVNEGKIMLTDGSPLHIRDEMTDTLAFIRGSLVITADDGKGHTTTLQQGEDYTISYDGSAGQTDASGKPIHILDIVILSPKAVTYILDYDATLVMEANGTINYSNSARIFLWGKSLSSDSTSESYTVINMAASSFEIGLHKICAMTNQPLEGAVFGLYNAEDGFIISDSTGADGNVRFKTNQTEGIILREHELFYLQEIEAPAGYVTDDTKHWFVFCNGSADGCAVCESLLEGKDGTRVPVGSLDPIEAVNRPITVELPATGGIGTYLHILCGVPLVGAPFVYGLSLRRKHERRFKK